MVFVCLGGCIVILRFCLLMSVFWWFGCGGVVLLFVGLFWLVLFSLRRLRLCCGGFTDLVVFVC